MKRPFSLIGERINHAFGEARRAWKSRDLDAYQRLAESQVQEGVEALTVSLGGTRSFPIPREEALSFLPHLVAALQEVTTLPLAFDSPHLDFQTHALRSVGVRQGAAPILNSLSPSRPHYDDLVVLVRTFDTAVVLLASEKSVDGRVVACTSGLEIYQSALDLVGSVRRGAQRSNQQILIDPGLYPVLFDPLGRVAHCLEAMRLVRSDPDLEGVHLMVGLSNLSFGAPAEWRAPLENAFLTLAVEAGLDWVLGDPKRDLQQLPEDDPVLVGLARALQPSRPSEKHQGPGSRQAEIIRQLFQDSWKAT